MRVVARPARVKPTFQPRARAFIIPRHAYARAAFHSVSTNCNYIVLLPAPALLYSHNAGFVVFPSLEIELLRSPFLETNRAGRGSDASFPELQAALFFWATRQLQILPATLAFLLPKTCIESQNVSVKIILISAFTKTQNFLLQPRHVYSLISINRCTRNNAVKAT